MSDPHHVVDNTAAHRFEIHANGAIAFLTYRMKGEAIEYLHSETPPELRGHGLAGEIAKFALDRDKAIGRKVIPSCPFVKTYIDRHPEYAPLVLAS
jgi:uncharacterized protein